MKRLVILNPQSRNGNAGRLFEAQQEQWKQRLGGFELSLTQGPGDATDQVRRALEKGEVSQILIAGGDGAINEAVKGYWKKDELMASDIPLGIINLGTGGDLFRTVESSSENYLDALAENRFRRFDAPYVALGDSDLVPFMNIASLGMAGEMLDRMKHSRFRGGATAYFYHTIRTLIAFHAKAAEVILVSPDGEEETVSRDLLNAFICNGRFSGGGMEWAPSADLESGHFCVTLVGGKNKANLVWHSRKVYAGEVERFPGTTTFVATEVVVRSEESLSLETDGEIVENPGDVREFRFGLHPGGIPLVM